jgi:hypothetical protein
MLDAVKPIGEFRWEDEEEPERWIEHTKEGYIVFKKTPRKFNYDDPKAPGFDKGKISFVGAYHAVAIFLGSIWHKYKERFSDTDFDEFSFLMSFFTSTPSSIVAWRMCYWTRQGDDHTTRDCYSRETNPIKITLEEAFNIMLDLVTYLHQDLIYELPQLVRFLETMLEERENHKEEWDLWHEAIERVRQGEEFGYE